MGVLGGVGGEYHRRTLVSPNVVVQAKTCAMQALIVSVEKHLPDCPVGSFAPR